MKVQEKGTDRRAELHVHIQGQVEELTEYGEYIDSDDKAICCYVPVEDGNIIKVAGKFYGTTLSVHWDLHVDGVLRKANNMISKAVKMQNRVKLDFDEALCQMDDGLGKTKLLDTQMTIVPVSGFRFAKNENNFETIGTIEVRLYVLRTFNTDFSRDTLPTYLDDEDEDEDHMKPKSATYQTTVPEYMIEFETNCVELDKKTANSWKKKLDSKRPSKDPWAIFRFHYRSKDAIESQAMKVTHNPKKKGGGAEPYTLELDPVSTLAIGAKPVKQNDSSSMRDGSTIPSRPSTPLTLGSPLPRSLAPSRATPSSSPLVQEFTDAEDAPSETAIVKDHAEKIEQPTGVEKPVQRSEEPTNIEKPKQKTEEPKSDEQPAEKGEESKDDEKPVDKSENTNKDNGKKEDNTPKRTESIPPTPALSAPAPLAPMLPTGPLAPVLPSTALKRPGIPLTADPKRSKPLTIADTRRQLKAMKARRESLAKKRQDLDSELEPYMEKMREEQERLARELEEETKMWREESLALRDETAVLAELKKAEGGE